MSKVDNPCSLPHAKTILLVIGGRVKHAEKLNHKLHDTNIDVVSIFASVDRLRGRSYEKIIVEDYARRTAYVSEDKSIVEFMWALNCIIEPNGKIIDL